MTFSVLALLDRANKIALFSKKPGTKVGAVLVDKMGGVIAEACNDYINPLYDNADIENEEDRCLYSEHAERRLIYSAIQSGIYDFSDKMLVVTHFPCCDCSRAIILIGIRKLLVGTKHMDKEFLEKWSNNIEVSKRMLVSNQVTIYENDSTEGQSLSG
ncbi:deaminase [Undibacterium sp. Di24W]|uniref:deaminase n=1 Tax=Undibacterium sp. Di24W TaxID=3413033 RepID=UPI003BEFCE95